MKRKILLGVLTVFLIIIWTPIIYASTISCIPTGEHARSQMSSGFAYTSTFSTNRGTVFQLYTSRDGQWNISWIRKYGDEACPIFDGWDWNWAFPAV